jgi:SNF2 family DNA or RNA helicase
MSTPVAWSWQKQAEQPPETWSLVLAATSANSGQLGADKSALDDQKSNAVADVLNHFDGLSRSGSRPIPGPLTNFHDAMPPAVVSIELRAPRFSVRSYEFIPRGDDHARAPLKMPDDALASSLPLTTTSAGPVRRSYTRVKPPEDVIGLVDRLSMLLEPPLESLLAGECLEFPAQPFPFQMEGVAFLYPRHAALLADEMGLGKTMQSITAMRLLIHTREVRRVLLVCPKPLVSNWCREFHRWAPELPLLVIEGDRSKRRWQWQQAEAPLMIANYELLRRDTDIVTAPSLHFDLVVLDESQRIKNRSGSTSQVVRAISRTRSWALTGTPVENSPDDLVGIFDFLRPGHLSSSMKPRRMGRVAGDYVLRRTKSQVLKDLPPKLFRDADLELLPEQRESYRLAEEEGVLRLTEMGDAATIQHVFELILRLKQICNFDPATGTSAKLERLTADMEEVAASGQKVLVFSQWVETLTTLRKRLARFKPLEYHGNVPAANRDDVLREFHDDPRRQVLLLSYGAGGVGLNLQFASYVFLFDRWWNPAVEDQAINRAHRIGAAGPVTVTRFLSPGTIEERIEQILRDKRELFDAIFSGATTPRLGLSQEQIFGLFRLKCPAGPVHAAG